MAIEALRGDKSIAERAQIYGAPPARISTWQKQLVENAETVLEAKGAKSDKAFLDFDAL